MSAQVLKFPVEKSTCMCCGTSFRRRRGEHWKKLCYQCWAWGRAGQLMDRAARLLREVR